MVGGLVAAVFCPGGLGGVAGSTVVAVVSVYFKSASLAADSNHILIADERGKDELTLAVYGCDRFGYTVTVAVRDHRLVLGMKKEFLRHIFSVCGDIVKHEHIHRIIGVVGIDSKHSSADEVNGA